MNGLISIDMAKTIAVKNENDLPPHITFEQFKRVYDNLTGLDQILWGLLWETGGRITAVLSIRWADIDINAKELKLLIQKKKKHTTIRIPLSNAMLNDLRNYMIYIKPDSQDYLFKTEIYKRTKSGSGRLTRQGAFQKIRIWGRTYLDFDGRILSTKQKTYKKKDWIRKKAVHMNKRNDLHPHMLRHGLAIYLLSQGVPLPAISRRLGHSNVFITQKSYLVITPELDRQLTAHVPMR